MNQRGRISTYNMTTALNTNLPSSSLSNIDLILDGEVMAFLHGKPLHFQDLQKRLRKKNVTERIMKEVPLVYVVYDIINLNGEVMIRKPLRQRKEYLLENRSLMHIKIL